MRKATHARTTKPRANAAETPPDRPREKRVKSVHPTDESLARGRRNLRRLTRILADVDALDSICLAALRVALDVRGTSKSSTGGVQAWATVLQLLPAPKGWRAMIQTELPDGSVRPEAYPVVCWAIVRRPFRDGEGKLKSIETMVEPIIATPEQPYDPAKPIVAGDLGAYLGVAPPGQSVEQFIRCHNALPPLPDIRSRGCDGEA